MKKWGIGWGNTISGLKFEDKVDFLTLISQMKNYKVKGFDIYFCGKKVAQAYKKQQLYTYFLKPKNIDYRDYISAQLLPDNAIFVIIKNTMFIVEIKFQQVSGSVDEKLQTCWFKKMQYVKLLSHLNIQVEYCYVLSERFKDKKYNDVLNYIQAQKCSYFFETLPLDYLWLPISDNE